MGRSRGQLEPRGENVWFLRVFLGRDANGKRLEHRQTVHGSKRVAQRELTALLAARDQRQLIVPTRKKVDLYLDEWLDHIRPTVSPRTSFDYEKALARYARPKLGHLQLVRLTRADLQTWVNGLTQRGLAPGAVRLAWAPFRKALRDAVKLGELSRDPTLYIELPQARRRSLPAFTAEQARRLLDACSANDEDGPLVALLLLTGLRPGEAMALKWSDLDGDTLRVQRALCLTSSGWELHDDTKTSGSRRAIPLGEEARRALARQRRHQAELRLQAGGAWKDGDLIFTNPLGGPLDAGNLTRRVVPRVVKAAGLPRMTPYALRHAHATLLLASGVNLKIVSERLGHSGIALTADTYSHVSPTMQAEAVERLERALSR
jgi:integrase